MPDSLDASGLKTKTLTEIKDELIADLKLIYGDDINVNQNSPDGQQLTLYSQGGVDLREILQRVYSSFDIDQAEGRALDRLSALNNIKRKGGTFSTTNVNLTVDQALNLIGLDGQSAEINPDIENLYTIKDDAGTRFFLNDSVSIVEAGTDAYLFRAADIGQVEILPNTITTAETIIKGVTNINNPSSPISIGVDQEVDNVLRIRRASSVAITSLGYLDSVEAALENLEGVITSTVLENDTESVDLNGTPPKTLWCIVEGGADADIAQIIYVKRCGGVGMRGAESVIIDRPNGTTKAIKFDRPGTEDLYIQFTINFSGNVDEDYIKQQIVENIIWAIGFDADASTITTFVKALNPNYFITGMEVSDDGATWLEIEDISSPQNRFLNDVGRIDITVV